jgi:hypothetical protein
MTTYVVGILVSIFFYFKKVEIDFLEIAKAIIINTNKLSTISLLLVFFGFCLYAFLCHKKQSDEGYSALLTRLLIGSFTASTIPTGISLILCAVVDMEFLTQMAKGNGLGVYIAYAGLSLISMTILLIFEEKRRIERLSKNDNHDN